MAPSVISSLAPGFACDDSEGLTSTLTVLGAIFVVAGAGLSLLATRYLVSRRAFLRNSDVTTGVVVALGESRDQDETSYSPTVRFRTAAGREVTFQSGTGSGKASWSIGDSIRVRYRRDQPDSAEVSSFAALWGPSLLFALLAVVFLSIGFGVLAGWLPVSTPASR